MFPPAATGSGASLADTVRTGDEVTVVVIAAPFTAAVSLLSTLQVPLVMRVPLASGLATRTTIWTEPEAPAARAPGDQVTVLPARAPPPVAETNVVLAGTTSVTTTPEALAVPVFENASV